MGLIQGFAGRAAFGGLVRQKARQRDRVTALDAVARMHDLLAVADDMGGAEPSERLFPLVLLQHLGAVDLVAHWPALRQARIWARVAP